MVGLAHIEAPVVVTSAEFEERLAPTRRALRLPPNLLERVSGVRERRWWAEGTDFEDMAAEAGAKALAAAGVDAGDVGLLVNTSVSRPHLEPSVAVGVHHRMGLPSSALNFDITNACLGFVNGLQMASAMIDSGQIDYAVVVDAEDVRPTQEDTLRRLATEGVTRGDYTDQFASLTLGDGAAAAVVGRASDPEMRVVVRWGRRSRESFLGGGFRACGHDSGPAVAPGWAGFRSGSCSWSSGWESGAGVSRRGGVAGAGAGRLSGAARPVAGAGRSLLRGG